MFGKLENGKFVKAPKRLALDGKQIFNPSGETLVKAGYKPVILEDMPDEEEGFYFTPAYTDAGDSILCSWRKEAEPASALEECLRILRGE